MLTPEGIADGFTLTTFLSGYPSAQYGPLAQGILPNGNVITGSASPNSIYVFADHDGQTLSDALVATPYTFTTGNPNYAMATAGGQVYGAQLDGGVYEKFNSDGTHTAIAGLSKARNYLGMWGNPVDGHIVSSSNQGLIDIDPVKQTFRVINPTFGFDGVTISPDGKTVYAAIGSAIRSYDYATGALLQTYYVGHRPDGTGVITGGPRDGQVVINNNEGTVSVLNPVTGAVTIIATHGTRGDFVSPDTRNGTLFLSQKESIVRLSCGPGCSIGGPPVPLPGAVLLFGTGLAGLGAWARLRHIRLS